MRPRIVFACSGSPGDCAAIPWLAQQSGADIVAMTLDVGQGRELEAVRHAALAVGAVRAHVLDVREEFAHDCILSALRGDGTDHPSVAALARPLIARKLVEIARIEAATAIAHGGDAGDHAAIEAAARTIDPSIRVIAAARDTTAADAGHTVRTTLWARSSSGARATASTRVPDEPAHLEIAFESGLPVAVNGVPMTLAELIESVTTIAGNHGVGRVTDDVTGIAREVPAAVVLQAAQAALGDEAMGAPDATVRVELFKGRHRIISAQHS